MKISKLPDKKEWDRIVDEAFTSNEEHRFSQRYVSHKNEMLGGINMKRRSVNNKSKNNSRKIPDNFEYSVSGVDMYKRPPLYRRVLTAAASLLLISGVAYSFYTLGRMKSIPTQQEFDEINTTAVSNNTTQKGEAESTIRPKIGEKFIPEGMVKNGGYLTVDSAEIFDDLKSAGIEEQNLLPNSLLQENGEADMLQTMPDGKTSVAYDKPTGKMINDWKIVKVHYTFENQSAVSIVNDFIVMPEEQYTDDVFMIGNLNVCNKDEGHMNTKMNYFCYKQIYFSLADSVERLGKPNHTLFKCSSGETVEFDIAYAFCCEPENLYMSATTGNKTSTMVDLELGGAS